MAKALRVEGDDHEVVTFVETVLPLGTDAIRAGGIEYVSNVIPVHDLPEWADAVRTGGTVYVPKTSGK